MYMFKLSSEKDYKIKVVLVHTVIPYWKIFKHGANLKPVQNVL